MDIAIPKETRMLENRVSLIPEHVSVLLKARHRVCVQHSAGVASGHPDEEYQAIGAVIKKNVYDCNLIVAVSAPPPGVMRKHQTLMAYLHVQKGQNPELLRWLLRKRVVAYAYEEIRDHRWVRVVNLGFEAGIVATYEALRIFGVLLAKRAQRNPFVALRPVWTIGTVESICSLLSRLCIGKECRIAIMGKGCVSRGVQHALAQANISPFVLYRDKTSNMRRYLPYLDILVNAVDWYPWEPHIIRRRDLSLMKRSAFIIDVSCDQRGAIESCIPQTWDKPTYECEGITHFAVVNLPSVIAGDASAKLSSMILPHVMRVASGEVLPSGLMTSDGEFIHQHRHP